MILPNLEPLIYQLPAWYARSIGINRMICSYPRRHGKDVMQFAMTVQDAIEQGGNHYYMFPTRKWADDILLKDSFTVGCETRQFWEWAMPKGVKAQVKEKDCCIVLPDFKARIQLGGTDDMSFVGRGGKSYTMSEFSLHKRNVTGYISPILRQSQASFRANGTLRGTSNQLYEMLTSNIKNPEWFVQWLKPQDTKCYCWISDEYCINPELFGRIGEIGPNMAPIFNVQDEIDSGMISMALARQEYLNDADTTVAGAYYGYELSALKNRNGIFDIDPFREYVYTFWDLGGVREDSDTTCIVFAVIDREMKTAHIVDYYENKGFKRGHYFDVLRKKGYNYAGHYFPHDAKRRNEWTGETSADTAMNEYGVEVRFVPKTNNVLNDIEITRRGFARTSFSASKSVDALITHLGNYHERETTGKPCHQNNCQECNGASHGADAFRMLHQAMHLGLVKNYLGNETYDIEPVSYQDDWMLI